MNIHEFTVEIRGTNIAATKTRLGFTTKRNKKGSNNS